MKRAEMNLLSYFIQFGLIPEIFADETDGLFNALKIVHTQK